MQIFVVVEIVDDDVLLLSVVDGAGSGRGVRLDGPLGGLAAQAVEHVAVLWAPDGGRIVALEGLLEGVGPGLGEEGRTLSSWAEEL